MASGRAGASAGSRPTWSALGTEEFRFYADVAGSPAAASLQPLATPAPRGHPRCAGTIA